MKLILGNPGSGKTKKILELSATNNIPVLCESKARVERLLVKAAGYGLKVPDPIYYEELDNSVKEVYVDDIERLLNIIFNCKIGAVSLNNTSETLILDLDKK